MEVGSCGNLGACYKPQGTYLDYSLALCFGIVAGEYLVYYLLLLWNFSLYERFAALLNVLPSVHYSGEHSV